MTYVMRGVPVNGSIDTEYETQAFFPCINNSVLNHFSAQFSRLE